LMEWGRKALNGWRARKMYELPDDVIRKINGVIDSFKEQCRADLIVPVANDPRFDASMGFETLDDAVAGIKGFMAVAEDVDPDQGEDAAYRDIALYRGGRILAVIRHGPGGVPEVTIFAPETGNN
jgi:hypothetical protein